MADTAAALCVFALQVLGNEVMSKHESLQELNYAADELIKSSTADQAVLIRDPLTDVNRRLESLHHDIGKKLVRLCATHSACILSMLYPFYCISIYLVCYLLSTYVQHKSVWH